MSDIRDRARALKSLQPKERFHRLLLLSPIVVIFAVLLIMVPGGNWNLPVKIFVAVMLVGIFFWRVILSYRAAKIQMDLENEQKTK